MQHNNKRRLPEERPRNPLTEGRLKLKALGYDPIPLRSNKLPITGWQTMPNPPEKIRRWGLPATGLRCLGHDTFYIDIDVTIEPVRDQILAAYEQEWPEFMRDCVRRHSSAVTICVIGRCLTAKKSPRTRRFYNGPEDKKGNLVETFTRNCDRQVVVQGAHSPGRAYGYIGRPLWDVPLNELPWFPDDGIWKALDIAHDIMKAAGLELRTTSHGGSGKHREAAERVFDLKPDQLLTLTDCSEVRIDELRRLPGYGKERITAYAWLWDPDSATENRVLVTRSKHGPCLYDTREHINHFLAERGPSQDLVKLMAELHASLTGARA